MKNKMDTAKTNPKVAEFMGNKSMVDGSKIPYTIWNDSSNRSQYDELLYHSSWEWLMPVVEKIEELGSYNVLGRKCYHSIKFDRDSVEIYFAPNQKYLLHLKYQTYKVDKDTWRHPLYKNHIIKQFDFKNNGRRMGLYKAVVEFIEWYNKNK